jgi:hypothetical protein
MAKRAVVALEGGEHDAAFGRFMTVLEEEARHIHSVVPDRPVDIGTTP